MFNENFSRLADQHALWKNDLVSGFEKGSFTLEDYRYIFSQYRYFNMNFTRILSTLMVNCDNSLLRSKVISNLWEEIGEASQSNSHTQIYQDFLTTCLGVRRVEDEKIESYSKDFVNNYLSLCLGSSVYECAAILSYATEGIVSRLYSVFKEGLLKSGLAEEDLLFFNLHINCDDGHAASLEEIVSWYKDEYLWDEKCSSAIIKAMDLRNLFFQHIYNGLVMRKCNEVQSLIGEIQKHRQPESVAGLECSNITNINNINNPLYENSNEKGVNFHVDRILFESSVIDPRLLTVKPFSHTELHAHAHESIFYVISGEGKIRIEDEYFDVKTGSFVYVPRWLKHQTINDKNYEMLIFATTDFKLTNRFPGNSDHSYREKFEKEELLEGIMA